MIGDALHIDKELLRLNVVVPVKRRSIIDYLDNGDYSYITRDGNVCELDSEEVRYLADNCSTMEKMRVRLPILVSSDASGDGTAWRVDGISESDLIARILNKTKRMDKSIRFFNPDLHILRKKLPTCTFVVFSV